MANEKKKYLTAVQVNREIGIPLSRLRCWIKQGKVPGFKSGNRTYIDFFALLDMIDAGAFREG